MNSLRKAVSFLTPFGGAAPPDGAALEWFPLVGAAIGALVGAVWWLADRAWNPAISGAVAVAADMGATGLLHFDGLADAADGLVPPLPSRSRRLDVMAAPDVGAFGLCVTIALVLLRFGAFAVLAPDVALIAALWCASRTVMAVAIRVVPYARDEGGLASGFSGGRASPDRTAIIGVVLAGLLAALTHGAVGLGSVLGVLLAGVAVVEFARARIGGFTGDVLGAAGVVGETVGLLVAAGKWR